MCAKCDDLHICCDIRNRVIGQYRYLCRLCDDTEIVAVMSNMVGEMSGIFVVFS